MKGQLTVEFFVSMIFFIIFVFYIYRAFSSNIPRFVDDVKKEDIRSKAYQISEVLLNDLGDPIDWETSLPQDIKRIGLSDQNFNKTNLISSSKMEALVDLCESGYINVQDKLSIYEPFSIYIFNINVDGTRTPLVQCQPDVSIHRSMNATVRRVTAYQCYGSICPVSGNRYLAEIIVQV